MASTMILETHSMYLPHSLEGIVHEPHVFVFVYVTVNICSWPVKTIPIQLKLMALNCIAVHDNFLHTPEIKGRRD
jgi:hypothetical protein